MQGLCQLPLQTVLMLVWWNRDQSWPQRVACLALAAPCFLLYVTDNFFFSNCSDLQQLPFGLGQFSNCSDLQQLPFGLGQFSNCDLCNFLLDWDSSQTVVISAAKWWRFLFTCDTFAIPIYVQTWYRECWPSLWNWMAEATKMLLRSTSRLQAAANLWESVLVVLWDGGVLSLGTGRNATGP